jgi:tape measure domain-containing protein
MAFTVDIRGNASHLEKTLGLAKNRISKLGSMSVKATAGIAALGAAGAAGLGALVITSSKAASGIEDLTIQMGVLTGSTKIATSLIKDFQKEEQKSALNTEDYANAAKTILAFGGAHEDIMPTLRMIGDVSMGNSERFASLALAFAQTTAAGRLMGQEVLQFVNAGFNPLEQISRDTGKSMAELKKQMEDGAISVQMVKQAFINATSEGGRFYKAIDKGSESTSAKINQTKAAVTRLQVAFGTGFNEGLKDALDATNNFLPQIEGRFKVMGKYLGSAITQAVNGNSQELAAIGGLIGEIVLEGFKSVFLKAMDELLAGASNLGHDAATSDAVVGGGLAMMGYNAPRFNDLKVSQAAKEYTQSAPLSGYIDTAIEKVSTGSKTTTLQIAEGVKTGVDQSMRAAVSQGVHDAWKLQEAQRKAGAKFSN